MDRLQTVMREHNKELLAQSSKYLKSIHSEITSKFGEKSCVPDKIRGEAVMRISVRVAANEIYGDITDGEAHLKCSSGPNLLNRDFIDALEFLYELVERLGKEKE